MHDRRFAQPVTAWHGNSQHVVDARSWRVATHFQVRRTQEDVTIVGMHNCKVFDFDQDLLISRITIWIANALT